jgi:hypothetical protein
MQHIVAYDPGVKPLVRRPLKAFEVYVKRNN